MSVHPLQWQSPQPLWARFGATGAQAAIAEDQARPAILRFASDDFMDQILGTLARDPAQIDRLLARPETWRKPMQDAPDLVERVAVPRLAQDAVRSLTAKNPKSRVAAVASTQLVQEQVLAPARTIPLKLYQPAHQRFYLVGASFVCALPGLPERAVVPGGVGNTELQLDAIAAIKPGGYVGTPSFLKILIEKAAELGKDVSSLKHAFVGAEALPPSLRQMFIDKGMTCLQSYGTADVGTIAYESEAIQGMIIDEGVIVEIVRPGTGDPVPEGDVGEVVVTTFNRAYPLIRFGTGDMSAVLAGPSPCGRTNMRIKGWMGRADQRTKVRGMFVDPEQIAEISRKHPGLGRLRLVIDWVNQADTMTLKVEAASPSGDLEKAMEGTIRTVCKFGGKVEFAKPGSLPNDGKVIDDVRKYT
jgi:hypothetical protein